MSVCWLFNYVSLINSHISGLLSLQGMQEDLAANCHIVFVGYPYFTWADIKGHTF